MNYTVRAVDTYDYPTIESDLAYIDEKNGRRVDRVGSLSRRAITLLNPQQLNDFFTDTSRDFNQAEEIARRASKIAKIKAQDCTCGVIWVGLGCFVAGLICPPAIIAVNTCGALMGGGIGIAAFGGLAKGAISMPYEGRSKRSLSEISDVAAFALRFRRNEEYTLQGWFSQYRIAALGNNEERKRS
ncbi:MAG: hypothetical protein H0W88_02130 [Parachlamydiaceae bacterium]|nr:hypothetical protein [Parachlamydiaceae bacterium]